MANAPYMYWVGMNTQPDTTVEELAKFNDFYSNTHAKEVLASNPGFFRATRYELLEQDARGDFGPRWLAVYEMSDEAAAASYIKRNDGPPEGRPNYSQGPSAWQSYQGVWRLIWHRIVPEDGELSVGGAPYIFMVGMNVPKGTDEAGLREFNEFYNTIHIPEVLAANALQSGARYVLHREFRHPEPGSPQFLAVYEGDDRFLEARKYRAENPDKVTPLSSGPKVWEDHVTAWRLIYRRVDSRTR